MHLYAKVTDFWMQSVTAITIVNSAKSPIKCNLQGQLCWDLWFGIVYHSLYLHLTRRGQFCFANNRESTLCLRNLKKAMLSPKKAMAGMIAQQCTQLKKRKTPCARTFTLFYWQCFVSILKRFHVIKNCF